LKQRTNEIIANDRAHFSVTAADNYRPPMKDVLVIFHLVNTYYAPDRSKQEFIKVAAQMAK